MFSLLYVDDEPDLLELAQTFLELTGDFSVTICTSVAEALPLMETTAFDAIISDYQMPGRDGIEFLKETRRRFGAIPFILFTGKGREEVVIEAINNGADFYLQKGGSAVALFAELAHKVRLAIHHREDERLLRLSEERLRKAQLIGNTGCWEYSLKRNTIWASAEAFRIYGFDRADGEIPMETIEACIPERERVHQAIVDLVENGLEYDLEFEIRPADGAPPRTITSIATVEKDAFGRPVKIVGVIREITEQRWMEAQIRESELRFRGIFEMSPLGMVIVDDRQRIVGVNPAFCSLLEYPGEALLGRSVAELTHPDHIQADTEHVRRLLCGEIAQYDTEKRYLRQNGESVWASVTVSALRDPDGALPNLIAVIEDISERRRTEEALRRSEQQFRGLVETSPAMIWEIDRDGVFTYMSPQSLTHLGYAPEMLIGRSLFSLIPSDHLPEVRAAFALHLDGGDHLAPLEVTASHQDGRRVTVEIRSAPFLDESGELVGFRGIARDTTSQRDAEEQLEAAFEQLTAVEEELRQNFEELAISQQHLQESEEQYRSLAECSPDYIMRYDREGRHLYMNRAALRISGLREDQIIGRTHREAGFDEDLSAMWEERITSVFETAGPVQEQFEWEGADGPVVLDWRLVPEFNPDGSVGTVLGVSRDITALKRSEGALRERNRQLDLLISITRHDIMNKTLAIRGHLNLARQHPPDGAGLDALLERLDRAVATIQEQIQFTRVYQDLGTHEPVWHRLAGRLPRAQVPEGMRFEAEVDGIEVLADPMLPKVFESLLDNTLRHGGGATSVRLSSTESSSGLTVVWEDDGIGVDESEKELIFERGYGRNTGLGLYLAREILAITGGNSRETGLPGSGARFEITLPPGTFRRTPVT